MQKEIAELDAKMQEAERLLKVADPDGYFKSGSRAAEAAKAKAQKAMQLEKQQRELKEQRRKEKLAAQKLEQEAFVPEEEADDEVPVQAAEVPTVSFAPSQARSKPSLERTSAAGNPEIAPLAAAEATGSGVGKGNQAEPQGLQIMKPPANAQESKPPSRQQIAARLAAGKAKPPKVRSSQQDIEAKVAADLAALTGRASHHEYEDQHDVSANIQQEPWKPPQGQRGDGKTSLNDKLGY